MDIKTKCDIGDTIFFKQGEEIIQATISKIEIEIEKKVIISYFIKVDNKKHGVIEEHKIIGRAI